MKNSLILSALIFISLMLTVSPAMSQDSSQNNTHKELNAFPAATAGMERFVISLPHKERGEENAFKVELLPGKMMMTDGVNRIRLGTRIESRPLKGWGYTYYEVTGKDVGMSTMMGVPAGTQSLQTFVSGQPLTIDYNSRLPIVIYVPKGQLVKYRIWKADETFSSANQG
ncbi:ecotin family protein [Cocleimonas sp. KMM 6892]|uniref:ecotin family protein n=1 Tax=unclassified Cocleimonas TaxID=2639732 RepID=UPI002DBDEEC0|nr:MULTISPECIES: ecotin family protein [unclassified Cocleimonas]MEB8433450.1 ecotin family protein [Cocleimonas sp. KMM 6892]MEC4716261.1 ecotin family protein [Cocleimonas sp. KMM 6895]MEC4745846.1 ecotin family protein [Cocleimonas sp. KMM 6896]